MTDSRLKKLLVTGAAGGVAQLLAPRLGEIAATLRLSDLHAPETMPDGAEFIAADLADPGAVDALVDGCDGILHFGGIATEQEWDRILAANIIGMRNLYEAARRHGRPRILFASSNHVVGFYRQDQMLDADAAHRPDGWYGISKSFGEAVALTYFERFGQETAIVRIGACFAAPKDHRMLSTWFAPEDFLALIARVFAAPRLGCPVIYGVSDNPSVWWDNGRVRYLGWRPEQSSARFAAEVDARVPRPAPDDPAAMYQGGLFTSQPFADD